MLDLQAEINSDFSVFHGIRDPMSLDSPRYFQDVGLLHHYGGAVAAVRGPRPIEQEDWTPPPRVTTTAEDNGAEIAALAAMSQHPGFPGIGYSGGG